MAKRISNMNQLTAVLMPTMESMVGVMADRVYETLNYYLQSYYDAYDPLSYRRSYDFLRSAVKVEPKRVGNSTPRVWDETIENTVENGELLKLAIEYLKSKGFSIRA